MLLWLFPSFCHCNHAAENTLVQHHFTNTRVQHHFTHLCVYQWDKYLEIYSIAIPYVSAECQARDSALRITTCLSCTLKSHHTRWCKIHDHYCEPPNYGCQYQQSGDKRVAANREGCNPCGIHLTLKALSLSAPIVGATIKSHMLPPPTFCIHLWKPGLFMSWREVFRTQGF